MSECRFLVEAFVGLLRESLHCILIDQEPTMSKRRRKRVSRTVPAKGRLREMADRLWANAVKSDWANRCAMCGRRGNLNSHHLIPRQHYRFRYELRNGCCLCARCHQFCPDRSPHQNPAGFVMWLEQRHHALSKWYFAQMAGEYRRPIDTKNASYFCGVIRGLREYVDPEEFERICGVRFAQWLEEN